MRKMKKLTRHAISSARNFLAAYGVREVARPGPEHEPLIDMLREVADKMDVPLPNILVHKGLAQATAYDPDYDTLVLSEKLADILSPGEFKAIMAHELDHHVKAYLKPRIENAVGKLLAKGKSKAKLVDGVLNRFDDFIEFSADENAAKLYGAENFSMAIQKIVMDSIEKSDRTKYMFFPEEDPDSGKKISKKRIAERVQAVVNGTYEPKGRAGKQLFRRFQSLGGEPSV